MRICKFYISLVFIFIFSYIHAEHVTGDSLNESNAIWVDLHEKIAPSIVIIRGVNDYVTSREEFRSSLSYYLYSAGNSLYRYWHNIEPYYSGAGFIISSDGYIITSSSLLKDLLVIKVSLINGEEYDARLVYSDSDTGLSLIKIEKDQLPFLSFGSSDDVSVDEQVALFTNVSLIPRGNCIEPKMSKGYVRGKLSKTHLLETTDYLFKCQIDNWNVNDIGGAITNIKGEIIGVFPSIYYPSNKSMNLILPINLIKSIVKEQMEKDSLK